MSAKDIYTTDEVFGITRDVPLNYVPRPEVDEVLLSCLRQRRHVVIHGGSKQGKTCLRKYNLKPDESIVVQCYHNWSLENVHSAILKAAGFQVTQSEKRTFSGKTKVHVNFVVKLFGSGGNAGAEVEGAGATETQTSPLELDLEDVNDIILALSNIGFGKLIILEDFHYLPLQTQKDFAVALKAFHEGSNLQFVIVGVWQEKNRLIVYNGDLTGRVLSVDADKWTTAELRDVVRKGESLLNVTLMPTLVEPLVNHCFESVYIVQEVCREICLRSDIFQTQAERTLVGQGLDVAYLIKSVVDQQSARYTSFITNFAEGFQDTELQMYRWILYPVLVADVSELEEGLSYSHIRKVLQAKHPSGKALNPGNLTQALQSTASLQVKKEIKPIILDYDQTNRLLSVVDRGFLIWLASQSRTDLLDEAGLPTDEV